MTEPVRIGLAGCGAIARNVHLRSLRRMDGVTVTALADAEPAALEEAIRLTPGAAPFATIGALLEAQSVDAVVVATPSALHAEHAQVVLEAGRALYLEKPVGTSAEDHERLAAALRSTGGDVMAATGFNRRFHPLFADLHRVLQRGTVGRCRLVRTAFCEPASSVEMPLWKRSRASGGGAVLDLASHHVDLVRWLTGEEVLSVESAIASESTEDDTATMRLALSGGTEAETYVSFRAARTDSVEVIGDEGVVRVDRYSKTFLVTVTSARRHSAVRSHRMPSGSTARYRLSALVRPALEPSYASCLQSFARAVAGGEEPTLATLDDGLRSLAVVLAAEASAREGRRVDVP